MAHELDMSNGRANAAFARTNAWHKLGVVLDHHMTGAEALREAGLDWTVETAPMFFKPSGTMNMREILYKKAVIRTDTNAVLGIVGRNYVPMQNATLSQWLDPIATAGAKFDSAGALFGGERIWFLADVNLSYEVVPGDIVHNYILLTNGHDGKNAFRYLPTSVRVVCNNTLTGALSAGGGFALRHDLTMKDRAIEIQSALAGIAQSAMLQKEQSRVLISCQLDRRERDEFFQNFAKAITGTLIYKQDSIHAIVDLLGSPTNTLPGMVGTAWQTYNAVSEWVDHAPSGTGIDKRFLSDIMGKGNTLKRLAWDMLLQGA